MGRQNTLGHLVLLKLANSSDNARQIFATTVLYQNFINESVFEIMLELRPIHIR